MNSQQQSPRQPIEEYAEEMADVLILLMGSLAMKIDLKSAFESKYEKIMQRPAKGRLGIRVTEYNPDE